MAQWQLLVYLFYISAALVNTIAAFFSLPYGPAYIAEIQFNEETFSGSVNGMSVQNLSSLRLGNWAACYQDSLDSGPCSEAAVPYQVTMTNGNFTHTIVQPIWTIGLVVQAFALLATLVATCLTIFCQTKYPNCYWAELSAVVLTLAAALPDGILYLLVRSEMQSVGETIVTNLGTAFGLIVVATLCLCVGAFLRYDFAKKVDKKSEEPPKAKMTFISGSQLASVAGNLFPPHPVDLPPVDPPVDPPVAPLVAGNKWPQPRNGGLKLGNGYPMPAVTATSPTGFVAGQTRSITNPPATPLAPKRSPMLSSSAAPLAQTSSLAWAPTAGIQPGSVLLTQNPPTRSTRLDASPPPVPAFPLGDGSRRIPVSYNPRQRTKILDQTASSSPQANQSLAPPHDLPSTSHNPQSHVGVSEPAEWSDDPDYLEYLRKKGRLEEHKSMMKEMREHASKYGPVVWLPIENPQ